MDAYSEISCVISSIIFGIVYVVIGFQVMSHHEKFALKEKKNNVTQPSNLGVSLTSIVVALCIIVVIDIPIIVITSIEYHNSWIVVGVSYVFDFAVWNLLLGIIFARYLIYFFVVIIRDLTVQSHQIEWYKCINDNIQAVHVAGMFHLFHLFDPFGFKLTSYTSLLFA